eukprot:TRINITY_DN856_c0_g1_i4.p1 TRINITY_DN856_c0_g1~~TRINITY_DN856_c0_g1_i4.p1  ORF type:complete len:406 (-),score=52.19 TRINITY_DN856_c0_g1_i4:1116-2333(-)
MNKTKFDLEQMWRTSCSSVAIRPRTLSIATQVGQFSAPSTALFGRAAYQQRGLSGAAPTPPTHDMEYRYLGKSGLKVSALGMGSWITFGSQLGDDTAFEIIKTAYNAGVNFFDGAEAYANGEAEEIMGRAFKCGGWNRSSLVVSTKIFWGEAKGTRPGPNDRGLSRKHIVEGTYAALKRLQLDYVDLIYCHRPDYDTPVEETVRAMNHVIDKGLALYWGTSEWPADRIMEAYQIARTERLIPPTMEQPEYSMLARQRVESEYKNLYPPAAVGLGLTTWSPLKFGILTGKYSDGVPEDSRANGTAYAQTRIMAELKGEQGETTLQKVRQLDPIAKELNCSLAHLAIAWCLKNNNVSSVIMGASKPQQVRENVGAMRVVKQLDSEVMAKIEKILDNKPPVEPDWKSK